MGRALGAICEGPKREDTLVFDSELANDSPLSIR